MNRTVERRCFVKLCAAAAAGANPALLAAEGATARLYDRTTLVDHDGVPITAQGLEVGRTYIFHYPYATTPCFLLDLGRPAPAVAGLSTEDGEPYLWPGGAGEGRSVVAFAAICAHRMSHPAREVSFINYRHGKVRYRDSGDRMREASGVIFCCSEKSVYDPRRRRPGARRPGQAAPGHDPAPKRSRVRDALRAGHRRRGDVRRVLREVRVPPRAGARNPRHRAPDRCGLGGHGHRGVLAHDHAGADGGPGGKPARGEPRDNERKPSNPASSDSTTSCCGASASMRPWRSISTCSAAPPSARSPSSGSISCGRAGR